MTDLIETEILNRTRRIETRLHRICTHFHIAETPNNGIAFAPGENDNVVIQLPGLDVTLATLKREIVARGLDPYKDGFVLEVGGESKGWLQFDRE